MNANELAQKSFMELWDSYTSKKMECEDLHEKICQQQVEIQTKYDRGFDDGCKHTKKIYEAEIEALKADSKRLDWIWKQAQRGNGGVFNLEGIHLFTVVTQHMRNTEGIRQMIDDAMGIDASGINDHLIRNKNEKT